MLTSVSIFYLKDYMDNIKSDDEDIELTVEQDAALEFFQEFLLDEDAKVMSLTGYAGTGKSTLVRILLGRLQGYIENWEKLTGDVFEWTVQLTATTNKAAEALSDITGIEVRTIHSFLGLRVAKNYDTGQTYLTTGKRAQIVYNYLLFIDEASMVDPTLLNLIFQQTHNCKIVFMGDPAQLTPVKHSSCPVFLAGFDEAKLTQVVRQATGSPINALATQFRETVSSGVWAPFTPDGEAIIHLGREEFDQKVMKEFDRTDWRYNDSKVLAYTNHRAVSYNNALRQHIKGSPELQKGDYAICNSYVRVGADKIVTDALVRISEVEKSEEKHGVEGRYVLIDDRIRVFAPYRFQDTKALAKWALDNKNWKTQQELESWIDLRAAYAQTINKSQGSTYDKVFIDLDDISTCTSGNQIARLMYVGVSRARYKVFLTGDFG